MNQKTILFLTLADVVEIHGDQIARYGGGTGIRDMGLLSSALAMPYTSFQGEFLHNDIFEMASAYAYYIRRNHPFVDGNKRTALAAALVCLDLNGVAISDPNGRLYEAMMSLASGQLGKAELAKILLALHGS